MVWQPEIEEMKRRRAFAEEMGGEAGIAEQRRRGKLTVRERIDLITDGGSFQEIGQLAGAATYENDKLVHVRPSNMIIGLGDLNGRKAVLTAGDFTVRGGASDGGIGNKGGHAQKMALDWKLPFIRLLDATGGSVKTFEQIGRTYIPTNPVTPGGVSAAYRRVIAESDDPEAKQAEIEAKLEALSSPFRTAEAFNIEDIIDPRESRPMVSEFVQMAQPMLETQLGPSPMPYMP
ncbi:MAG: hypothetical protein OXH68_16945 [Gammaproteobacteria bacterium]|nr:hypothetical protein [Gammaproteobacteria bacterium]